MTNTQFFNIAACISGAASAFAAVVATISPNPSSFVAAAGMALVLLVIFTAATVAVILMES